MANKNTKTTMRHVHAITSIKCQSDNCGNIKSAKSLHKKK